MRSSITKLKNLGGELFKQIKKKVHLVVFVLAVFVGIIMFDYYGNPTSGATVTLAIITGYYAWQTRVMVDELRRDRYTAFLDRRLEKLYTPLLNSKAQIKFYLETFYIRALNRRIDSIEIRRYTYLASDELKKELEDFLEKLLIFENGHIGWGEMEKEYENLIKKFNKIMEIAERDAEKYRRKFIQLRNL